MNRREFIGSGVVLAARAASGTGWSSEPWPPSLNQLLEPVNLHERIRLGQNALLGGLDPTQNHLPYWSCRYDPKVGFSPHHSGCRDHDVGRALHGLSLAEEVTGWRIPETVIRDLAEYQFALFGAGDGLPGTTDDTTGKWTVNLHNVRESMNGLTALIKWGDKRSEQLARKLVRTLRGALDDTGKLHRERLPNYVRKSDDQPSQEGRSVDALVRYYRVTADPVALETATLITNFALENCFAPDGTLAALAGGHGHSINALVAGMLDLAMLTNDRKMLERARRVFDVGLPSFNTSFGWSLETVPQKDAPVELPLRGEANNTADLLRAALILGRAGFPEYFGRAELILRGHLLPSQLVNVTGFSDDPQATNDHLRSLGSRAKGGFSFPTANELLWGSKPSVMVYDITSGAVDGMCEAWHAIVTNEPIGVRVNLLFDCARHGVTLKSGLSREGRVEIVDYSGRNVLVRRPAWVLPKEFQAEARGELTWLSTDSAYLLIQGNSGPVTAHIQFPVKEDRIVEGLFGQVYTIDWRGDQIVGMCPPGRNLAMFPACK